MPPIIFLNVKLGYIPKEMDVHGVLTVAIIIYIVAAIVILLSNQKACPCKKVHETFQITSFSPGDFDVYLINMSRNVDRLQVFIEQYKASDMNFKNFFRYEAIDGNSLNLQDYVSPRAYDEIKEAEKNGYRMKHYQLTPGAVGCYLSHQNLLRIIRDSDKSFGIVFEDDSSIDKNIYGKLTAAISRIPSDWDILLLGCHCINCVQYDEYKEMHRFFQTHGYVIKKQSAKFVSEYIDKLLIEQQIDTVWSEMATKGLIKIICLNDQLALQNNTFKTTIQLPIKYMNGVDPYKTLQIDDH